MMSFSLSSLVLGSRRVVLLSVLAALTGSAVAQPGPAFPTGPLRIVVPFTPGGAADTFARLIGQKLGDGFGAGQAVVIDNKPGAAGMIGSDAVAKAPADGHTLLMVTVGHAVNPYIFSKLPYNTQTDFVPVGMVASVPSLLVTGPSFSGKTLADLIAQAKAKPGALEYASSGIGTTSHVGAALIESMAKVDMTHIPYKGASPALQDVMGGRVAMSVDIITSSLQLVKTQKLRALAITGPKRSPLLPDVPTVAEAGLPGYEFLSWYLLLAPAKTPRPVVEKLNAELRRIEALPDFQAKVQEVGGDVVSMTTQQANDYLNAEFVKWARVTRERNIKAD